MVSQACFASDWNRKNRWHNDSTTTSLKAEVKCTPCLGLGRTGSGSSEARGESARRSVDTFCTYIKTAQSGRQIEALLYLSGYTTSASTQHQLFLSLLLHLATHAMEVFALVVGTITFHTLMMAASASSRTSKIIYILAAAAVPPVSVCCSVLHFNTPRRRSQQQSGQCTHSENVSQ